MAKKQIKSVGVAIGNCGVSSNYNDEEREKFENIIEIYLSWPFINSCSGIFINMKDTLHRTTVFLTKDQHEKLRNLAFKRRKSMARIT